MVNLGEMVEKKVKSVNKFLEELEKDIGRDKLVPWYRLYAIL